MKRNTALIARLSLLGLLALSALSVSACGSSSKSSSSSRQLPRAEFAKKADAICTQENKKRQASPPPPKFNPATATKAQIQGSAGFLQADGAITRDEISRVSALGEPKEKAPKQAWHTLRADFQAILPLFQKLPNAARAGDVKAFRADFAKLMAQDPIQAPLTKQIGLKVCGQG